MMRLKLIEYCERLIAQREIRKLEIDFPYLISFPRTGSHWLRILLEEYTNQPLLPRSFKNHYNRNYLLCHSHDLNLSIQAENVIYLYRDPVDVVYSQMKYYNQEIKNKDLILFWTHQYACHVRYWLNEKRTKKKIIVTYENMISDLPSEFKRICSHLDINFDSKKIAKIAEEASKKKIKSLTTHDQSVVNVSSNYELARQSFSVKSGKTIQDFYFDVLKEERRV